MGIGFMIITPHRTRIFTLIRRRRLIGWFILLSVITILRATIVAITALKVVIPAVGVLRVVLTPTITVVAFLLFQGFIIVNKLVHCCDHGAGVASNIRLMPGRHTAFDRRKKSIVA
jgi:hypothetical protein